MEYSIENERYKKTKNINKILIDGWCFDEEDKKLEFTALLNGKSMDVDVISVVRNDIYQSLEKKPVHKDIGFHINIDCTNIEPKDLKLSVSNGVEKIDILSLNSRQIKKIVDTKLIEYYIDGYCENANKNISEVIGWAYSWDQTPIECTIQDKVGNSIEYTKRTINRDDLVRLHVIEENNKSVGFKINFDSQPKEQYYLIMKVSGEEKKVKLSENIGKIDTVKSLVKYVDMKHMKKAIKIIRSNGVKQLLKKLNRMTKKPMNTVDYQEWFLKKRVKEDVLKKQTTIKFSYTPKISIIVATFNTKETYLKDMIDTVKNQSYSNWELCIADGSTTNDVEKFIKTNYDFGSKLKFIKLDQNYGIAGNMNKALELATGDYVGLYDHDDFLELDCFYEMVKNLQEKRYDFIYTDEDKYLDNSKKFMDPHFKSDFNLDLLRNVNYICHFLCVKKSLIDKVGNFRKEFDGAQDFDFVLRLAENTSPENIYHIPKILYHWRMHELSTAENPESKMYAFEAGKRAVQAHYDRLHISATVSMGEGLGLYRSRYKVQGNPLISILIPNKDHIDDLQRCIDSIEKKSSYKNYEYIIIENNSTDKNTFDYYERLEKENKKVKVVYWKDEFNYSAINNFGAKYAKGDYYLLLNNDTEIINDTCLEELLGYCQRDDVGAVGARLYYHDDTIQHGGVVVGVGGIAGHVFVGEERGQLGYFGRIVASQDLSAVTAACMMVKKSVFEEVHGLSEDLKVAFNDIDFCMKIRQKGYLIVYNPYAELYHYESKSRGQEDSPEKVERFNGEIETFSKRWPDILKNGDPYYNINLSLMNTPYTIKSDDE